MISKSKRLTTAQFDEVFKNGRVFHSSLFVIRTIVGTKDTRFSAVSSQKLTPKSSQRNISRRVIYSAIATLPSLSRNSWLVIIAKKQLEAGDKDVIVQDLRSVFVKIGILE